MEESERASSSSNRVIKKPATNNAIDERLRNNCVNKAITETQSSHKNLTHGSSVKERPLVVQSHCIQEKSKLSPISSDFGKRRTASAKSWSRSEKRQLTRDRRSSESLSTSTEASLISINFTTWRASAGNVVESIRQKLNYFRRTRNADKEHSYRQDEDVCEEKNADRNELSRTDTLEANSLDNATNCAENLHNSSSSVIKSTAEITITKCDVDTASTYDNDSSNAEQDELPKYDSAHQLLSSDEANVSLLKIENERSNDEDQTEEHSQYVRPSLCSPCIGSSEMVIRETSIENEEGVNSAAQDTTSFLKAKVVHSQPSNNQTPVGEESASNTGTDGMKETNLDTPCFVRPHLINIPSVKLQTASPTSSVNQELNLKCEIDVKDSVIDAQGSITSETLVEPFEILDIPEKPRAVDFQSDGNANKSLIESQRGINLWNLRKSLEQSTIEIQYPGGFEDFESGKERRFSVATETSPLSTPSSDLNNFRGKSISDSDDERAMSLDRAYYVTPSGRLSPCQPNTHYRQSSGFSSSPERSGSDVGHSSEKNFSDYNDIPFKNVFVTTATIENQRKGSFDTIELFPASSVKKTSPALQERRTKFLLSHKRPPVEDNEETLTKDLEPKSAASSSARRTKLSSSRLLRQSSLPLSSGQEFLNVDDDIIEEQQTDLTSFPSNWRDKQMHKTYQIPNSSGAESYRQKYNAKTDSDRSKRLYSSNSVSSDDVFLQDYSTAPPADLTNARKFSQDSSSGHTRSEARQQRPRNNIKVPHHSSIRPLGNIDIAHVPRPHKTNQRPKFRTKLRSATSSGTSSPTSPSSSTPEKHSMFQYSRSIDLESDDSISSYASGSRSSSNIKSLAKIFRRPNKTRLRSDSAPTFCGYSLERDYCIDAQTDRIFKEFLCQTTPEPPAPSLTSGEPLPPLSHMVPPPPLKQTSSAQLRRQVMRKQYSDSIALYYGQRQRKLRFAKQKSDSVNYPVDRGTFKRQDCIDEEFDPEEINERLSSTSSRRDSEKSDLILPTVRELKEWRQSSEEHRALRPTNSFTAPSVQVASEQSKSVRRVTFKQEQIAEAKDESEEKHSAAKS